MRELIGSIIKNLKFTFPYTVDDYLENLYLENYHKHTDFSNSSTPDCAEYIENYVKQVKNFGAKCLYSGEHGSQGNHLYVYKIAEAQELKYRHSAEVYWVKDRFEKDSKNCHMMLIAKNKEGRDDINYIISMANIDGYYHKPRIDLDLLLSVPKDNIIVTSACVAGWKYDDAEDIWIKIHNYFGDNFFLELQYHQTQMQKDLNKRILAIAKNNDMQIICGLDSHFVRPENEIKRDQILKYKGIQYENEDGWYLDYPNTKEVINRFQKQGILSDIEIMTAIMNTNVFVNECREIVIDKGFKIPSVHKNKTNKEKCDFYKHILNIEYAKEKLKSKEKIKGIRYEVNEVIKSDVVDYFLTSKAIVDDAVNNEGGILTTTSRGSAASFVTNKLLGLTTVDRFNSDIPIYPERFLTSERVLSGQMPDIDLNVAIQEPFVKSAKKLLGEHGCYPLMSLSKLKEKAAWQLYSGASDVDIHDSNQISKYLDNYNKALKYAEDEERELINVEDFIPDEYLELYKQSLEYQGITINLIGHPCGHLIFDGDIRREIGLISAVSETTKKRILCACVEGDLLDEFGYVKEDFLIVDSVHLTHKFFHEGLGIKVPTFDELREMIKDDKKTWEIYEKGITCCVNQCEKEATANKGRRYKPKNLAELSAFIAGIRPGFASLLNTFLNREEYTTGEKRIDALLEDSSNFMIYQESIMKILGFLDVSMGDTYGVIKSISKKKLKGEKKEELLKQLKNSWEDKLGNINNFDNVWNVIEDSARYAFNSPHAYSMGGDSAYQAWFKAHHTQKFYEIAINHYQSKNKKDKINALIKESMKFYSYRLGDYEFGKDNRKVSIEGLVIYPNLSSIKSFGEKVAEELYEIGKTKYDKFVEILEAIEISSINKTIVDKLIKLNYFNAYGDVNTLLETTKLYELLHGKKEISKAKLIENNIDVDMVIGLGHETAKKINKLDTDTLLKKLITEIPYRELTIREKLDNQREILGIVSVVDSNINKRLYYISELDVKKSIVNISAYEIHSGKTRQLKMWANQYNKLPFALGDILYISSIDKKNKREPNGSMDDSGKKIWVDIPDKFEYWLNRFTIQEDIDER